jgi:hypothetical protein
VPGAEAAVLKSCGLNRRDRARCGRAFRRALCFRARFACPASPESRRGNLIGIVLMVFWRRLTPALLIVISPLTLNFSHGIAEWFHERPSIFGWGLPSSSACNLDPDSRCYFVTGGCVIVGGEWVFDTPHNSLLNGVRQTRGTRRSV